MWVFLCYKQTIHCCYENIKFEYHTKYVGKSMSLCSYHLFFYHEQKFYKKNKYVRRRVLIYAYVRRSDPLLFSRVC